MGDKVASSWEEKKKISDGRRKNKGKGAGEGQQQQKIKTQQPTNRTIKPNPGDTEAASPGPSRTARRPDPLCASVLAHGLLPKQGRRRRWEDWCPFSPAYPHCGCVWSSRTEDTGDTDQPRWRVRSPGVRQSWEESGAIPAREAAEITHGNWCVLLVASSSATAAPRSFALRALPGMCRQHTTSQGHTASKIIPFQEINNKKQVIKSPLKYLLRDPFRRHLFLGISPRGVFAPNIPSAFVVRRCHRRDGSIQSSPYFRDLGLAL